MLRPAKLTDKRYLVKFSKEKQFRIKQFTRDSDHRPVSTTPLVSPFRLAQRVFEDLSKKSFVASPTWTTTSLWRVPTRLNNSSSLMKAPLHSQTFCVASATSMNVAPALSLRAQ